MGQAECWREFWPRVLRRRNRAADDHGRVRQPISEPVHPRYEEELLTCTSIGDVSELGDLEDWLARGISFCRTSQTYLVVVGMFFQLRRAGDGRLETT